MRAEVSHRTLMYAVKKDVRNIPATLTSVSSICTCSLQMEACKKTPEPFWAAPAGIYLN